MVNHARNLLINHDGSPKPDYSYPLSELIPPDFTALAVLPPAVSACRSVLFGANPDPLMLNYRVRQLLTLVHSSPYGVYLTALDPRITYNVTEPIDDAIFQPQVQRMTGSVDSRISIFGVPASPDSSGQTMHRFTVKQVNLSPDMIQIEEVTPRRKRTETVFNTEASPKLGDTGYHVRLWNDDNGQAWFVEVCNRPQWDIMYICDKLTKIGEPTLDVLLGVDKKEPFATFRNLWFNHPEKPLNLVGLVLAMIYRTEERRVHAHA